MNGTDQLIADGLREIADQAAVPPRLADASWRAGRHHRRTSIIGLSAAALAGATAVAVMIPLALSGGPRAGGPGPSSGVSPSGRPGSAVRFRAPILFEQVASVSDTPCAPGPGQVPGPAPDRCVHLTGTGMTITRAESARVVRVRAHQYGIDLGLTRTDTRLLAAMTSSIAGQLRPHYYLAIIYGQRAVAVPRVDAPLTGGHVQIFGFSSAAQAGKLLRTAPSH